MAPPFVDENPGIELVSRGLEVADDEVRDAMVDRYVADALGSETEEEALDDIDYEESQTGRNGSDREPGNEADPD